MNHQKPDISILLERWSHGDFQTLLVKYVAFQQTQRRPPSLRSLAMRFNVAPSTLSRLLSGHTTPSSQTIEKIGACVGLDPVQVERLVRRQMRDAADARGATLRIERRFDVSFGNIGDATRFMENLVGQIQNESVCAEADHVCSIVIEVIKKSPPEPSL